MRQKRRGKKGGGKICETTIDSPHIKNALYLYSGIALGASFVALVVILYLFTHHVYQQERELDIPARGIGQINENNQDNEVIADEVDRDSLHNDQEEEAVVEEEGANESRGKGNNNFILTKQAFHQSLLYVSSFFLVYLPVMIMMLQQVSGQNVSDSEWRFWLEAIILPLGGVFNILIYTRPKVLKLKEQFPMLMKWELFLIVLMKGGETPSMADVRAAIDLANAEMIQEQGFEEDRQEQHRESNLLSYDIDVSRASEFITSVYQTRSSFWMRG
ncbi:predicted protein [Chaetoceros tenuissimus]|uniref:Uncharacterized protein n=1 Tax=Chaetoceros tenuissimus TaxID=426638 RepID=A0AAD3DDY3_9STRA|nr:predicted protein [Chaetoceros tenuissimus]